MENWGLVIYDYSVVVYNTKKHSIADEQFIAEVMCHELAHQVNPDSGADSQL
jgi:aminopeptidase N